MANTTTFQPTAVPGVYGMYPNLALRMCSKDELLRAGNYIPLPPPTVEIRGLIELADAWAAEACQALDQPQQPGQQPSIPPPPAVPNATELEDVPQRTALWHLLRKGRVTASKVAALLGVLE